MERIITYAFVLAVMALPNLAVAKADSKKAKKATSKKVHVDSKKLVEQAEKFRNPKTSHKSIVTITDNKPGRKSDIRAYESYINGKDAGLVKFLKPESDIGKQLLIKKDDMYVKVPTSANPIRISPRQKLTGNAAYGDVVSIDYVNSYESKFLRMDKFKGKTAYVVELNAVNGKLVTYDRIEYWIEKSTKKPLKANFMTKSGKVLRVCEYTGYKKIMGTNRPTKLVIENHLNRGHKTTIAFNDFKKRNFPNLMFRKEALGRN